MVAAEPGSAEIASRISGGNRVGSRDQDIEEIATETLENVGKKKDAGPDAPPARQYMTGWRLYALTFA
jgi:hypothetical protein